MKKIMMLMIVAVMMLGVSQQAMAAFADGDLIRVVFSTNGTNEVATDLGSITSLTSPSSATTVWNANNFNFSQLGGTADASNSYVVYLALTASPTKQAWTSGPAGGQTGAKQNFSGLTNKFHLVEAAYAALGGGSQVTLGMSDPNSFWTQLTSNGATMGSLSAFVAANNANISLASLPTAGYVDAKIYYYNLPNVLPGNIAGTAVSTIRTYADGHSALNPSTVPVPAAAYLFGSGLVGLAGLRRKFVA